MDTKVREFKDWAARMSGRARFRDQNLPEVIVTTAREVLGMIWISQARHVEDETTSKSYRTVL